MAHLKDMQGNRAPTEGQAWDALYARLDAYYAQPEVRVPEYVRLARALEPNREYRFSELLREGIHSGHLEHAMNAGLIWRAPRSDSGRPHVYRRSEAVA